jgi:hypothetical protein
VASACWCGGPFLDRIGPGLNEWTDLGLFDTDILSAKAHEAGFTLACCRDLFIQHFGTRTFAHGARRQMEPRGHGDESDVVWASARFASAG